jgi:hypothetical protein
MVKRKFPGVVRSVGCFVGGCSCGGKASDHCCGKAIDLMVKVRLFVASHFHGVYKSHPGELTRAISPRYGARKAEKSLNGS